MITEAARRFELFLLLQEIFYLSRALESEADSEYVLLFPNPAWIDRISDIAMLASGSKKEQRVGLVLWDEKELQILDRILSLNLDQGILVSDPERAREYMRKPIFQQFVRLIQELEVEMMKPGKGLPGFM